MANHKKIPHGISNFEKLITQNYYYVDKTRYIEVLESFSEPYICFFRPQHFGKTLFVSMLYNYYDKSKTESFNKLFGDLYIGKNPTPLKNSYAVLHFDFSGIKIQEKEKLERCFYDSVLQSLRSFACTHKLDIDLDSDSETNISAASLLNMFLGEAQFKLKQRIYVIIDEYDHFARELLAYDNNRHDESSMSIGFLIKFFEVLKIGTSSIIDRIFYTGLIPLTLDSLTSGFNISSNLTLSPKLQEMMGFNEAEIETLFAHYNITGNDFDRLLPMLKAHYDGYIFSRTAENHLYNSNLVLYFAKYYLENRQPPENLIDDNIASSYSKIKRFIELGDYDKNLAFIRDLLEGKEVNIVFVNRFEPLQRFTADDFKSLFFYMGLVTIEQFELGIYTVGIPNYVIKELYLEFFRSILGEADANT